ncbi:MAG TPA: P-loop NTPase [Solirubrobacteraceae bacterium]|nr:P-loop NTPase [Solirubrobacteraceae bacterium]
MTTAAPGGIRLAVVGKGGAGKSVVAATLARLLARRGHRVLALDSDTLPGLSISLGAPLSDDAPLNAAAERDENGRWQLARGIGPARAVQRFSIEAPDGVRLLQLGKTDRRGLGPNRASHNAFYQIVHRLEEVRSLKDWAILGDLPAGPRQTAYDWAPYARRFLLVVEPTWQSMLTARRIVRIAREHRDDVEFSLVVNKVTPDADVERAEQFLGVPLLGTVPADDDVHAAERAGVALLDHAPDAAAVRAVERLADVLDASTMERL